MKKVISKIKEDPSVVFFIICIIGFISYLALSVFHGHDMLTWLLQENDPDIFATDYWEHFYYSVRPGQLYTRMGDPSGCFPPLAYVMYYFLYRLTAIRGYVPSNYTETVSMQGTNLVYVYYTLIVAFLIFIGISLIGKKRSLGWNVLLFICLMVSPVFLGSGIFVGNSTMLVLAFLLIALAYKDSESPVKREIALILIAISACLKIYPAVFGLLYLKEKRFKEAIRMIIYGIILFVFPFFIFGGAEAVSLWLGHIKGTMGILEDGRIEYIKGVTYQILSWFGLTETSTLVKVLCTIIPNAFLILMIFLAAISKNKYRTLFFLAAAITLYPSNAFRYTLSYFTIPLIFFIQEYATSSKDSMSFNTECPKTQGTDDTENKEIRTPVSSEAETWFFIILNSLVFAIPTLWGIITGFNPTFGPYNLTYVEVWIYISAYLLVIFEIIMECRLITFKKETR